MSNSNPQGAEIQCVRQHSHPDPREPVALHYGELIHRRSPFLGRPEYALQDILQRQLLQREHRWESARALL